MRKLSVIEFLSLDGVMQAPGRPDEDTEGGFTQGGWLAPYQDETLFASAAESMADTDAYLFGRKTYQSMAAFWPTAPAENPFTEHLNRTTKYVASRTLRSLDWQNSVLFDDDVIEQVGRLKDQPGGTIAVMGSGDLVQTLIRGDLVDEYFLIICPILLGAGKRLFRDADQVRRLNLVNSQTSGTGSLILTYRPAR